MKISEAMRDVHRLAVETAPFIYYVENHPIYAEKMDAIFQIVEAEDVEISVSVITLTECLKKPVEADDQPLIHAYRELLMETDHIHLSAVTSAIAEKAAYLRANYHFRTPDALHLASAIDAGCDTFLTNDKGIQRIRELKVLLLDDLELDTSS